MSIRLLPGGLALALLLGLTAPFAAQTEVFNVAHWSTTSTLRIYTINHRGGQLGSMGTYGFRMWPRALITDETNTGLYVLGNQYGTPNTGWISHLTYQGVMSAPIAAVPWLDPFQMLRTGDGSWYVLDNDWAGGGVVFYEWTGKQVVKRGTAVGIYGYGAGMHPGTGKVLIRGTTRTPSTILRTGYFSGDPVTGKVNAVAVTFQNQFREMQGANRLLYDAATDAFWDIPFDANRSGTKLLRVNKKTQLTSIALWQGILPVDMVRAHGRDSARPFRLMLTDRRNFTIYDMDRKGSVTSVGTVPPGLVPYDRCSMPRQGERTACWFMLTPPNNRMLKLVFPHEVGRPYVVGLSFRGVTPGVPLPDGRTIPINPDPLTLIALNGGIRGILQGTVGKLDSRGEAFVNVNLSNIGSVLKGMRVVAAALVLDAAAPSGIAQISEVVGFTVK